MSFRGPSEVANEDWEMYYSGEDSSDYFSDSTHHSEVSMYDDSASIDSMEDSLTDGSFSSEEITEELKMKLEKEQEKKRQEEEAKALAEKKKRMKEEKKRVNEVFEKKRAPSTTC